MAWRSGGAELLTSHCARVVRFTLGARASVTDVLPESGVTA